MGVLNVAGPPDDELLVRSFERTNAAYHGGVSVTRGEGPFGRCGTVLGLGLDGRGVDVGRGFGSRGCVRGAGKVAFGGGVDEGRNDGKVMAYVEDTTGEMDTLGGEIGLVLNDLLANVFERDLG